MADSETKRPKTPEEKTALEQKRDLRRIRDEMKSLRKQAKEISVKRKELAAQHEAMSKEAGVAPRKKKSEVKTED